MVRRPLGRPPTSCTRTTVCDAFFAEIGNQSARLKSKSKCKTQVQEQELKITIEPSNSPTLSSMSTSNARTSFFSRVKVFSTEQ